MSIQLVQYFEQAYENDVKLRFWFRDINMHDDAIVRYVKEVFINPDGSLLGLGLSNELADSAWEYYAWDTAAKFGYSERDQEDDEYVYCTHCEWLRFCDEDIPYCPFEDKCDIEDCDDSKSITIRTSYNPKQ